MKRTIWVLGGDGRMFHGAKWLKDAGYTVYTYDVVGFDSWLLPSRLDTVVLPFPSVRDNRIRGKEGLPMGEVLELLHGGSCVFGGLLGKWKEAMQEHGAQVYDLYGVEPFTTENACLTAEGTVSLLMQSGDIALQGKDCLIIGFGRIGKCLAQKLQAMGMRVTVAARKSSDLALISALGYDADRTGEYHRGLGSYRYVINTVPAEVLTGDQLKMLRPECFLVELASLPGGFSEEICLERNVHYTIARSLPATYAPHTAGILYAQSILSILGQGETT